MNCKMRSEGKEGAMPIQKKGLENKRNTLKEITLVMKRTDFFLLINRIKP